MDLKNHVIGVVNECDLALWCPLERATKYCSEHVDFGCVVVEFDCHSFLSFCSVGVCELLSSNTIDQMWYAPLIEGLAEFALAERRLTLLPIRAPTMLVGLVPGT